MRRFATAAAAVIGVAIGVPAAGQSALPAPAAPPAVARLLPWSRPVFTMPAPALPPTGPISTVPTAPRLSTRPIFLSATENRRPAGLISRSDEPTGQSSAIQVLAGDTTPVSTPDTAAPSWRRIPLGGEADLLVRSSLYALSAPLRWSGREWALAAASVGAVALASTLDESGRELMADVRNERNTRIEAYIEPFGAERSLVLLGGMLGAGLVLDDEKLRGTAVEGLAAGLVAAGIITPQLQLLIGRAKPREDEPAHTFDAFSGDRSHPSGHTTQAFAVASVIATEYDHPLVQVGAYGMATAVGLSRMYRRSHFLSDVLGGAIIGTAVGTTVARYGMDRRGVLSVKPVVGGGAVGLQVRLPI